jgi:hypothetical protein
VEIENIVFIEVFIFWMWEFSGFEMNDTKNWFGGSDVWICCQVWQKKWIDTQDGMKRMLSESGERCQHSQESFSSIRWHVMKIGSEEQFRAKNVKMWCITSLDNQKQMIDLEIIHFRMEGVITTFWHLRRVVIGFKYCQIQCQSWIVYNVFRMIMEDVRIGTEGLRMIMDNSLNATNQRILLMMLKSSWMMSELWFV